MARRRYPVEVEVNPKKKVAVIGCYVRSVAGFRKVIVLPARKIPFIKVGDPVLVIVQKLTLANREKDE